MDLNSKGLLLCHTFILIFGAVAQPPRLRTPLELVIHQCHVHIVALKGMKKIPLEILLKY